MSSIIELKDVEKTYRLRGQNITALERLDLEIEEGDSVAILGPSGSGKSTLLHILSGLDVATHGEVIVLEKNIQKLNDKQLAEFRNTTIGFVFQDFRLIYERTAVENVMLPLLFHRPHISKKEIIRRSLLSLDSVGLKNRANHKPSQLSGGEQQRVAIARAIVTEPLILVADEPTGNLDQATGQVIMNLLKDLHKQRDTTLVMATHDAILAKLCNRSIKIIDGKVT